MTLARRVGTVIVLESGVYFPMLDLDRPRAGEEMTYDYGSDYYPRKGRKRK